jgi:cytochrome c-type biogenesis protein CcmH/NrfG
MRAAAFLLLAGSVLTAQDEAFFAGNPRPVLEMAAQKLEALKPKDAKLMAEAARFYFLAGQTRKAEELLRFAELLDPKDSDVQRLLGRALLAAGRKAQALAAYEKVLVRDSPSRGPVAQSAIDLAEARLPKEAARFMDAYIGLDSKDWETFVAFGRAYLKAGDRKSAASWFHRAMVLQPTDEDVYLGIGRAFSDTVPRP